LKQKLDKITDQKLATEDRVSHLDGALKECMRQLRHVREDQEQRIHEIIVKRAREFDELRQDMEAKLAEVCHDLDGARAELLECRRKAFAASIVLEDNKKVFAEIRESKSRLEAEVSDLQVQLEAVEKKNYNSEHELQFLRKELDIRNEERAYERKATEIADKKQVENAKKISKLEAEAQKLRVLMRKKLPGPAALAQMKIEVNSLDRTNIGLDAKGKSSGMGRTLQLLARESAGQLDQPKELPCYAPLERSEPYEEAGFLAERLVGMDDELKTLRERLGRSDKELQISRLTCAKTASKLSTVEEQLEIILRECKCRSVAIDSPSQKARIEDNGDSWDAASALLAELDHVKQATKREPALEQLHLMDDFVEMERLAMATGQKVEEDDCGVENISKEPYGVAVFVNDKLLVKEGELAEANRFCKEISQQRKSRNYANEADLVTLQDKLDMFIENAGGISAIGRNTAEEVEVLEVQSSSIHGTAAPKEILYVGNGSQNEIYSPSRSTLEIKYGVTEEHSVVFSDLESKPRPFESDLRLAAVRKIMLGVAALIQITYSQSASGPTFEFGCHNGPLPQMQFDNITQWKHSDLYDGLQCLVGTNYKLLEGRTDVVECLTRLATVLNCIVCSHSGSVDRCVQRLEDVQDQSSKQEHDEISRNPQSKSKCLDFRTRAFEEDSFERYSAKLETKGGIVFTSDDLSSNTEESQERESSSIRFGNPKGHLENQGGTLPISRAELDRDLLLLYSRVAALEGELQGERQRHQDLVLK
jgi:hypothetical protein